MARGNSRTPTYLSTFVSGLEDVAASELQKNVPGVSIISLLDGAITYQTATPPEKIKKLPFFNNSFAIIQEFNDVANSNNPLDTMLRLADKIDGLEKIAEQFFIGANKTFRIICSKENQLTSPNKKWQQRIEQKILMNKNLTLDRSEPDVEFWLLYRSEGVGFFMARLTKNVTNKQLRPGELRPELAYLLCALSGPHNTDVFLDPFCGYGAIPLARAAHSPAEAILAIDQDDLKLDYLNKKIAAQKNKSKLIIKMADALHLKDISDGSVTKIVTDPPWGIYDQQKIPMEKLYTLMLAEFHRVLAPGGLAVVLTAKKLELSAALKKCQAMFSTIATYDILVSGKKVRVYKLQKN